jgi:tRNA nucleotidyltransferase/poly(A) polymerase
MDAQTEGLAREAVRMGFHAKLSGSRVRGELIALLSEKDAWRAFRRLMDLGAAKELEPAARLSPALGTRFDAVEEAVRRLDPFFAHSTRQWLAQLMAVMQTVPLEEVAVWSREMRLRREDAATLARGVAQGRSLAKCLSGPKAIPNSVLDETLGEVPQEILAYVWALGGARVRTRVEHYLEHVADVKPAISGRDLLAMGAEPSPELGRVLAVVRAARLDGKVIDKPGELGLARELLGLEPLGGRALRKAARRPGAGKRLSAAATRAPGRGRTSA